MNTTFNRSLLFIQATSFIRSNAEQFIYPSTLAEKTVAHLKGLYDYLSTATIEKIVIQALTEYRAQNMPEYIDIDESTAYQVAIRDPKNNQLRIYPIEHILKRAPALCTLDTSLANKQAAH